MPGFKSIKAERAFFSSKMQEHTRRETALIKLLFEHGITSYEIAAKTGIPERTVLSRLVDGKLNELSNMLEKNANLVKN